MQEFTWSNFHQLTKDSPPWPRLVRAASLVGNVGDALDLGCGAGRDTRYLLAQGFRVTAVDGTATALSELGGVSGKDLSFVQSSFEDFEFAQYDLVNAHYALPFTLREQFSAVFARLKASLKPGGIFVGQFFGIHDTWNTSEHAAMTFLSHEQALAQLEGLELIECTEEDQDGSTADGTVKHWHVFHIIARKP